MTARATPYMIALFLTFSRCRLKPAGYMGGMGVQTHAALFVSEKVPVEILHMLCIEDSFP